MLQFLRNQTTQFQHVKKVSTKKPIIILSSKPTSTNFDSSEGLTMYPFNLLLKITRDPVILYMNKKSVGFWASKGHHFFTHPLN